MQNTTQHSLKPQWTVPIDNIRLKWFNNWSEQLVTIWNIMYTSREGFCESERLPNARSGCKYDVIDKQNKNT